MNKTFDDIKDQIFFIKEDRPHYVKILDFYEEILKIQESVTNSLNVPEIKLRKDLLDLQKKGFPLLNKHDFILDIKTSLSIFRSICEISRNITEKMKENVQIIETALKDRDLEELIKRHYDESFIKQVVKDLRIDKTILEFFIHMSILPSINKSVDELKDKVDLTQWMRGYCPICGSLPQISEIKESGKRYFLCSFCGYYWQGERLKCPFCENRDHNKLHYFYEEGKDAYRIDLCDNCRQYIKTIDTRKLTHDPNLYLEDMTTLHLDILATTQGYKRPAPTPWGI